MRKINTTDVFEALRLVQKSGLRDELVPVIEDLAKGKDGKKKSLEQAGILGFLKVLEVFSTAKCEQLIYEWLARPFECKPAAVSEWDLTELAANLQRLGEENDLKAFFTALSGLTTTKK